MKVIIYASVILTTLFLTLSCNETETHDSTLDIIPAIAEATLNEQRVKEVLDSLTNNISLGKYERRIHGITEWKSELRSTSETEKYISADVTIKSNVYNEQRSEDLQTKFLFRLINNTWTLYGAKGSNGGHAWRQFSQWKENVYYQF
jgi:hypothetical protein